MVPIKVSFAAFSLILMGLGKPLVEGLVDSDVDLYLSQ
jgi:hypothetical protein